VLVTDYDLAELHFAYCYHAYLRWGTRARRPCRPLATLDGPTLQSLLEVFDIRVLECEGQETEARVLVSLQPQEPLAACASKLKGRVSKWLRESLGGNAAKLLGRGYFACTAGKSTLAQVEEYLSQQGAHHGYSARTVPPVCVRTYDPESEAVPWWHAEHAHTRLLFHIVFATWRRRGVFGPEASAAVAQHWEELQREQRFALRKVSFLPDHVHLAAHLHPGIAPAQLAAVLMNDAQRLMFERFPGEVIRAGVERLWQPAAYIGSVGELASPQLQQYIRNWATEQERERNPR
jgi:REP element-mobilizing transposase RayT